MFCKEEREGGTVCTTKSEAELVSNIGLGNFSFSFLVRYECGSTQTHNFVGYEQYYFKT